MEFWEEDWFQVLLIFILSVIVEIIFWFVWGQIYFWLIIHIFFFFRVDLFSLLLCYVILISFSTLAIPIVRATCSFCIGELDELVIMLFVFWMFFSFPSFECTFFRVPLFIENWHRSFFQRLSFSVIFHLFIGESIIFVLTLLLIFSIAWEVCYFIFRSIFFTISFFSTLPFLLQFSFFFIILLFIFTQLPSLFVTLLAVLKLKELFQLTFFFFIRSIFSVAWAVLQDLLLA